MKMKLAHLIEERKDEKLPPVLLSGELDLITRNGPELGCTQTWKNTLVFSKMALKKVCEKIEIDLCMMLARRKNLIGQDKEIEYAKLARGKIAEITTFHLARAHIIHLSNTCDWLSR